MRFESRGNKSLNLIDNCSTCAAVASHRKNWKLFCLQNKQKLFRLQFCFRRQFFFLASRLLRAFMVNLKMWKWSRRRRQKVSMSSHKGEEFRQKNNCDNSASKSLLSSIEKHHQPQRRALRWWMRDARPVKVVRAIENWNINNTSRCILRADWTASMVTGCPTEKR